jgi:hypothetical protein
LITLGFLTNTLQEPTLFGLDPIGTNTLEALLKYVWLLQRLLDTVGLAEVH